jgi:ATP-binding cassette subfamily C protein CydD
MQQVLIKVELWDFLAQYEGLDYRLGDFGAGLSGGQQQRLALARLLLQQKPIWLLDEPFAELDEDTAARLSALLQHISKGKTLLLVSHQHSQLSWLSRAIRIEQGQLLTDGTVPQDFTATTTASPTAKPQTKGLSDG